MIDKCSCSMCPCKNKAGNNLGTLCTCCRSDIHSEWTKKYMKERGIAYVHY